MILAMGDNVIGQLLDEIQKRVGDWFSSWLPSLILSEWIGVFFLFLAVMLLIGWFLMWPWARATIGFIVLIGAAFTAGGVVMWRELNKPKTKKR